MSAGVDSQTARLLRSRARQLAHPRQVSAQSNQLEVLRFRTGSEAYAVELAALREVVPAGRIARVPRSPTTFLGLTSVRGEVLPVFELAAGRTQPPAMLVLLGEDSPLALAAESIHGLGKVDPAFPAPGDSVAPWVRGITAEAVSVIDAAQLLADPAFHVTSKQDSAVTRQGADR